MGLNKISSEDGLSNKDKIKTNTKVNTNGKAENLKINNKFLSNKFVQEYLLSKLGDNSIKIIKAANGEITDEAIAAKCKLKVAEIRSVLNKLHNLRLASYTRIRDKNTGWYSYVWKVDLSNIYAVLDASIQEEIKNLEKEVEESTTVFSFYCPKCSKENKIDFEMAASLGFRCPSCYKQLKSKKDETQTIIEKLEELKKKYAEFKQQTNQQ